jgi:hypothetical protein
LDKLRFGEGMGKSIFPTFPVNVPVPPGTAVPPPSATPIRRRQRISALQGGGAIVLLPIQFWLTNPRGAEFVAEMPG